MRWWRSVIAWRRWMSLRRRGNDVERELRSHLDLEAEEQQAAGLSADDARYAALRGFGNTTFLKEEVRNMSSWTTFEQVIQDVRYAFRGVRNSPGFATIAIL